MGEGGSYFSSSSSFMSLKNEMFYERLYSGAFVRAIFVSSLLLPYLIQLSTKSSSHSTAGSTEGKYAASSGYHNRQMCKRWSSGTRCFAQQATRFPADKVY